MKRRSNRGCLLYGIGFFVGLPFLLAVIGVMVIAGRERAAKQKLRVRLDKIAAQDLPVDDATMLSYTNSQTSKEDTKEWLAALGELTSDEFSKSTAGVPIFDPSTAEGELFVPAPEQSWQGEKVTREFLSKWSNLNYKVTQLSLKQLESGAKPVRFLTKFDSVNTLLPQTQNMRSAARLLLLNGQVAIYERNSAKARLHIEAMIGCSRTISGEPILVSQLVQIAIEAMGINLLKSALEHDVLSEKDLLVLLPRILDGVNINPQWKAAMYGERAMMMPIFQHPERISESAALGWMPGRSTDANHYLDFMDQVLAVPDEDFDEFKAGMSKVEQDLKGTIDGSVLRRFDSIMTGMMMPATAAASGAYVRDAAQSRMAALCVGVRLYEKRLGKMPTSLDDLKSLDLDKLTMDPARLLPPGDKPFGYRIEENQILLWGFDLSQASETPPEPPPTDDGQPNAEINEIWIWTLRTK